MLKVCIIGSSGHYGYAVERMAEKSGDFYITAVSDCPAINCDAKQYENYLYMLDKEKPDIAVVNPYLCYNAQISIECLRRGINVFAEKPAATTLDDLTELKKVYTESGKIYSSMTALRFAHGFIAAKEFVDSGGIGEVRLIHSQKSYKLGQRGDMYKNNKLYGGTIPWVGFHAVDWIYYFAKKKFLNVFAAQSRIGNRDHGDLEMTAACSFVLEDEIIATVNIDYLRPNEAGTHGDDRIRIVGTHGIVEVRNSEAFVIDGSSERKLPNTKEVHIFDEFIKAVRGEKNELPKAEDAFYVTEVCLKARLSAEKGEMIKI